VKPLLLLCIVLLLSCGDNLPVVPGSTTVIDVPVGNDDPSGSVYWTDASRDCLIIAYSLKGRSDVKVSIFSPLYGSQVGAGASDLNGLLSADGGVEIRALVSSRCEAGCYTVVWDRKNEDGQTVGGGLYGIYIKAGSYEESVLFEVP